MCPQCAEPRAKAPWGSRDLILLENPVHRYYYLCYEKGNGGSQNVVTGPKSHNKQMVKRTPRSQLRWDTDLPRWDLPHGTQGPRQNENAGNSSLNGHQEFQHSDCRALKQAWDPRGHGLPGDCLSVKPAPDLALCVCRRGTDVLFWGPEDLLQGSAPAEWIGDSFCPREQSASGLEERKAGNGMRPELLLHDKPLGRLHPPPPHLFTSKADSQALSLTPHTPPSLAASHPQHTRQILSP